MKFNHIKTVFLGLVIGGAMVSSCTKADRSDDFPAGDPPPVAGGITSSDQIASANLIGYWGFNGNLTESKQNLTGVSVNTSFTTGIKGQALQGTSTGYVIYNGVGAPFSGLKSFTITFWMKSQRITAGATAIFQLVDNGDFWPNLHINIEPTDPTNPAQNFIRFKSVFKKAPVATQFPYFEIQKADATYGKWTEYAITYDEASSAYTLYQGGSQVYQTILTTAPNTPMGPLNFVNVSRILFGNWNETVEGRDQSWMANYEGALDEFRIYNKALSPNDIGALTFLEKTGR